jgi:hypothetical protein
VRAAGDRHDFWIDDGGALIMSTYGHPSEKKARERIKDAWRDDVTTKSRLRLVD